MSAVGRGADGPAASTPEQAKSSSGGRALPRPTRSTAAGRSSRRRSGPIWVPGEHSCPRVPECSPGTQAGLADRTLGEDSCQNVCASSPRATSGPGSTWCDGRPGAARSATTRPTAHHSSQAAFPVRATEGCVAGLRPRAAGRTRNAHRADATCASRRVRRSRSRPSPPARAPWWRARRSCGGSGCARWGMSATVDAGAVEVDVAVGSGQGDRWVGT